jgi:hypothetical protein
LGHVRVQLEEVDQQLTEAQAAERSQHHALKARDTESDLEICTVIDEVHNTLGRPAQSVDFALIVGTGRQQWTRGNPRQQPVLMRVLAANLRSTDHPGLQPRKEGWASRINAAAQTLAQAVKALEAAELEAMCLVMRRRALAQVAQVMLSRLKRDFINVGMNQAQIHEIIPRSRRRRRGPAEPEAEVRAETTTEAAVEEPAPERVETTTESSAEEPAPESGPRSAA